MDTIESFRLLGVKISAVNLDLAEQYIEEKILSRQKVYVCVAPVSTVMTCQDDEGYRHVINDADMVTPDGMPVVWCGRRRGFPQTDRTYGPDLMELMCGSGRMKEIRHYFYGSTEETLQKLEANLTARFPGMIVAGRYAPPFRELQPAEEQDLIDGINRAGADLLWVGLGSPKQEFWMARFRSRLNVPVMIGVGAAFDFLAGTKPQAPLWMQRTGLEWLFRLCCEPRRLWKRYLVGNVRFVWLLFREMLKKF